MRLSVPMFLEFSGTNLTYIYVIFLVRVVWGVSFFACFLVLAFLFVQTADSRRIRTSDVS
mgnify:CR=1 FL=1